MKYTSKTKPLICPKCGTTKIAIILYGMPAYSAKLKTDLEEGRVVLGGCCITDDDPVWKCIECGTEIYKTVEGN